MFETFLTAELGSEIPLALVNRGQGCCYTHSNAQGNPHHNEAFPRMPTVLMLRNPVLEEYV